MPEHTREDHIAMMEDPGRWPLTVVLPLVKRRDRDVPHKAGEWPGQGFLYQPKMQVPCPPEPVVYLGNVYEAAASKTPVTSLPQQSYDSMTAIVDDGWEVD